MQKRENTNTHKKSSNNDQEETKIKLGCGKHKIPNHIEKRYVSNEYNKA
jgi:hypothetical protein